MIVLNYTVVFLEGINRNVDIEWELYEALYVIYTVSVKIDMIEVGKAFLL